MMEMNRNPKGPGPAKKKIQVLGNLRSQGFAKCVARKCPSKNVLDVANVGAFGICFKCGESEHFRCAGTKDEEKKDIIEGTQSYICSKCLFKNPIALVCGNNVLKTTNTVTTLAQINTVIECNLCEYVCDSKNKLAKHMGAFMENTLVISVVNSFGCEMS